MSEAEKHLAENAVDIILLDLGLPDAQGLAAVRRAHAVAPRVPLVVLTGMDDEVLAAQALQEGAQDYLIKGQNRAPAACCEPCAMPSSARPWKRRCSWKRNAHRSRSTVSATPWLAPTARGNITFLNLVAEKMTGWSLHEAAGRPMAEVFQILDATSRETTPNPMEMAVESEPDRAPAVELHPDPARRI